MKSIKLQVLTLLVFLFTSFQALAAPVKIQYAYDDMNRLIKDTRVFGAADYAYDEVGNILSKSVTITSNLINIEVIPFSPYVVSGQAMQYTAIGTYLDGTTADLTGAVTWSSSDPSAVITYEGGVLTGLLTGNAGLYATLNNITSVATPPTLDPDGDLDGDGLTNEDELLYYGTDLNNSDTNGDGFSDSGVGERDVRVDYAPTLSANSSNPEISSDDNGNIYVVWEDDRSGGSEIYFNHSNNYWTGWQPNDIRLDRGAQGGAYLPQISSDNSGNIYVAWVDSRNGFNDVYFNYSNDYGVTWQPNDTKVGAASVVGKVYNLRISSDSNGNIYVLWGDSRYSAYYHDIYFNHSNDYGVTWQASDVRLNTGTGAGGAYLPQISNDSSGNVYAVWEDTRSGALDIYLNYSNDFGATWQLSDIRLDTDPGAGSSSFPQIDIDIKGNVYVVWEDNRDGPYNIYFNRSEDYGVTWQASDIRLDTDPGTAHSFYPRISSAGNGKLYVVWEDNRDGPYNIYFNRSEDYGATWQASDIRLDTGPLTVTGGSFTPRIISGEHGEVSVVWTDHRNGVNNIYLNRSSDNGVTWQANDSRLDANGGAGGSYNPRISGGNTGYVVWEDERDGGSDVYFNSFYYLTKAIFLESFEGGLVNWTATGIWNQEAESDACGSQASPFPLSSNAVYYGIDGACTYNTGSANSGTLTMKTPVILPATGNVVLSFSSYEKTECGGECSWDNRYIEISSDNGTTWDLLGKGNDETGWHAMTFDLGPYRGKSVLLRFRFDSVDGVYNDFFGWLIDDITIFPLPNSAPTGFPFSEDFESGLTGWTSTGIWNHETETATCGAQATPFPGPSGAAYYGIDGACTYNTGSANSGTLTMKTPATLPATGNIVLSFSSYEKTECGGECSWDNRYIELSSDNGATWQLLGKGNNETGWHTRTLDLTPYLGKDLLVRFRFDSMDGIYNSHLGWLIDDISIDFSVP